MKFEINKNTSTGSYPVNTIAVFTGGQDELVLSSLLGDAFEGDVNRFLISSGEKTEEGKLSYFEFEDGKTETVTFEGGFQASVSEFRNASDEVFVKMAEKYCNGKINEAMIKVLSGITPLASLSISEGLSKLSLKAADVSILFNNSALTDEAKMFAELGSDLSFIDTKGLADGVYLVPKKAFVTYGKDGNIIDIRENFSNNVISVGVNGAITLGLAIDKIIKIG